MGVKLASARGLNSIFEPGLVLLNTQTFSAANTVSFPDNTFTASYNTYLFTFDLVATTADSILAQVSAGGTYLTSGSYGRAQWEPVGATVTQSGSGGNTSLFISQTYDADAKRTPIDFILTDIQVSGRYKSGQSRTMVSNDSGTPYPIIRHHTINSTVAYDSIKFTAPGSTITGSITCYGYNQ